MILSLNDDRLIMEFLSGRYMGEAQGYGIHVKYPLSYLISCLYKLVPDYDWYGYTMLGLMILCVVLICLRIWKLTNDKKKKGFGIASVLALAVFAAGEQFVSITYSTVAAIMGATILFLYGTSKGSMKDAAVLGVLSAATWCLRYHLFYMILPAAGLIWLFRDVFSKKNFWEKLRTPLLVVLCVGGSMLFNSFMYGSADWKEFEAFNNSRITIYDNPNDYYFPPYEEKREYYDDLGLNRAERRLLIYYGMLLGRDEIPTDTFHKMVEIREDYGDNESEFLSTRFKKGTKNFVKNTLKLEYDILFYAGCLGYAVLLLILIIKKQWIEFGKILLVFGTQLIIFWAMEMNGRTPERVIYSLSIMIFLTMLMSGIWEKEYLPKGKVWCLSGIALCGILCMVGAVNTYQTYQNNKEIVALNYQKEAVVKYCNEHPENFYFISSGELCTSGYNFYFGKVNNEQMNYMSTGDWISYSPMQQERLEQEGWESAVESMLNGENIYFVSGDNKYLAYFRDYLEYRCERLVVVNEIESLGDVNVYQFEMIDEEPVHRY